MEMAFYEATAQILPVLFLTLVVEHRLLQRDTREDLPPWLSTGITSAWYAVGVTFTGAELSALYALATGEAPARSADNMIVLAYLVGIATLVYPLLNRANHESDRLGYLRGFAAQFIFVAAILGLGYGFVELIR